MCKTNFQVFKQAVYYAGLPLHERPCEKFKYFLSIPQGTVKVSLCKCSWIPQGMVEVSYVNPDSRQWKIWIVKQGWTTKRFCQYSYRMWKCTESTNWKLFSCFFVGFPQQELWTKAWMLSTMSPGMLVLLLYFLTWNFGCSDIPYIEIHILFAFW